MAQLKPYLGVAMMAVVLAAMCGCSNSAFYGDDEEEKWEKRKEDDGDEDVADDDDDHAEKKKMLNHACLDVLKCVEATENFQMFEKTFSLRLKEVAQYVPRLCTGKYEFSCNLTGCFSARHYLDYINSIMELICLSQEGLHSCCWGDEFNSKIDECSHKHLSEWLTPSNARLECYASVPRNLTSCNERDASFLKSFVEEMGRARDAFTTKG